MKQCSKCKKWKDESEFGKQSRHKDGLSYWCKDCKREYARRYYKKEGKPAKKYYKFEQRHRIVDGVSQKLCCRCKKWKPENEFYKRSRHKDGFAVWCKECADEATNACRRRRTAANRNNKK